MSKQILREVRYQENEFLGYRKAVRTRAENMEKNDKSR